MKSLAAAESSDAPVMVMVVVEPTLAFEFAPVCVAVTCPTVAENLPCQAWVGTNGGALTHFTDPSNWTGFAVNTLLLFVNNSNTETLSGQEVAWKVWADVNLSQAQVENEYLRFNPMTTANLYGFLPLTVVTNAGVDMSGNGNNWTVQGVPTTQRNAPPIPWRGAHDIQ